MSSIVVTGGSAVSLLEECKQLLSYPYFMILKELSLSEDMRSASDIEDTIEVSEEEVDEKSKDESEQS